MLCGRLFFPHWRTIPPDSAKMPTEAITCVVVSKHATCTCPQKKENKSGGILNNLNESDVDTAWSRACPLNNDRGHFPDLIFPVKMVQSIYSQSCECSGGCSNACQHGHLLLSTSAVLRLPLCRQMLNKEGGWVVVGGVQPAMSLNCYSAQVCVWVCAGLFLHLRVCHPAQALDNCPHEQPLQLSDNIWIPRGLILCLRG